MDDRFETFTMLMNRINRNSKIKNQEMAEFHPRSAHICCLYNLYGPHGPTATDLCERCEEDKVTSSRALEYLKNNGCLTVESRSARRQRRLTDKGAAFGRIISDSLDGAAKNAGK